MKKKKVLSTAIISALLYSISIDAFSQPQVVYSNINPVPRFQSDATNECGLDYQIQSAALNRRRNCQNANYPPCGTPEGDLQPVTFTFSDPSNQSEVLVRAFIWFTAVGKTGTPPNFPSTLPLTMFFTFNGSWVSATQLAIAPNTRGTCWGNMYGAFNAHTSDSPPNLAGATASYFCDVTSQFPTGGINFNLSYTIDDFPAAELASHYVPFDMDGVSLMLIYRTPTWNQRGKLTIWDGLYVNPTQTSLPAIFTQTGPPLSYLNNDTDKGFIVFSDVQGGSNSAYSPSESTFYDIFGNTLLATLPPQTAVAGPVMYNVEEQGPPLTYPLPPLASQVTFITENTGGANAPVGDCYAVSVLGVYAREIPITTVIGQVPPLPCVPTLSLSELRTVTQTAEPVQKPLNAFGKIYPNPNDGTMRLDYHLEEGQKGEMVIFDIFGKKVSSYMLLSKSRMLKINQDALKSGIYFYEIRVNGEYKESDKITIIK